MARWENRFEIVSDPEQVVALADALAEEGWELITVAPSTAKTLSAGLAGNPDALSPTLVAFFRRSSEKAPEDWEVASEEVEEGEALVSVGRMPAPLTRTSTGEPIA